MPCCNPDESCGSKQEAAVQAGLGGTLVAILVAKFGPALADLILDLLLKKNPPQGVLPMEGVQAVINFPAFNIKELIATLVTTYGKTMIEALAVSLEKDGSMTSKFVASIIRSSSDQIIDMVLNFLQSPQAVAALTAQLEAA
jgi:uncharacterized membrane protein